MTTISLSLSESESVSVSVSESVSDRVRLFHLPEINFLQKSTVSNKV